MNTERDKFLTEAMGKCWHVFSDKQIFYNGAPVNICKNYDTCKGKLGYSKNTDFSTWEGFGKLWEWSLSQSWFEEFKYDVYECSTYNTIHQNIICPNNLADSLYEYLKEQTK